MPELYRWMQPGARARFRTFYNYRFQTVGCEILGTPKAHKTRGKTVLVRDDFGRKLFVNCKSLKQETRKS